MIFLNRQPSSSSPSLTMLMLVRAEAALALVCILAAILLHFVSGSGAWVLTHAAGWWVGLLHHHHSPLATIEEPGLMGVWPYFVRVLHSMGCIIYCHLCLICDMAGWSVWVYAQGAQPYILSHKVVIIW